MSALQELGMLEGMRPRQLGMHTSMQHNPRLNHQDVQETPP
jgi:hypothetical protein